MLIKIPTFLLFAIVIFCPYLVWAQDIKEAECPTNQYKDLSMNMCMPLPESNSSGTLMFEANGFLTSISESGPRGRSSLALPDMFMLDAGRTVGSGQYFNLEFMGTIERWTFPDQGYPELLQIGEENNQGVPYIDAQHPHSSPIMGLTLSDTINLGSEKRHLRLFAAPRGEATEGPVAFMHRPTGRVNPDAPLGHHIGQDVGHIVSTLLGESLKLQNLTVEFSTYHGAEPKPQNVDLPLGNFDSYSFRLIEELTPDITAMESYAYINNPEPSSPDIPFENRYSTSVLTHLPIGGEWSWNNTLIWGTVTNFDHASTLTSFCEEFLFNGGVPKIWGRIEVLQRTAAELSLTTPGDANLGRWVEALTLGYTHRIYTFSGGEVGLGASVTNDLLPTDFQGPYGGNPWTGKIFLHGTTNNSWTL